MLTSVSHEVGHYDKPSRTALSREDFPAPVAPHTAIIVCGAPWFFKLETASCKSKSS